MNWLLDANVLSELLRGAPDPAVLAWFGTQPDEALHVSAITQAEMVIGVRRLPEGKRQAALESAVAAAFGQTFAGRILPFDATAADAYATFATARQAAGRPASTLDAQIAAVAMTRRLGIVTRNVRDFEGCGCAIENPWLHPHR